MNKPAVALGVTTLLFAASTAYLGWQLSIERQRMTPVMPLVTAPLTSDSPAHLPESAVRPNESPQPSGPTLPENPQAFQGPKTLDASGYLRMLDNPEARADALKATRASLRISRPGLNEYLGLSAEEGDRLLDLLAEQSQARYITMLHCETNKGCDARQRDLNEVTRNQQLEALLGTEKYERYQTYQDTLEERKEVNRFRAQLPAAQAMSDDQTERLIAALADERVRFGLEVSQQGVGLNGMGTLAGGVTYYPSTDSTAAQQIESVTKYSARMRERASQILSSRQSAFFNQTQDDALAGVRAKLLQNEAAALERR